MEFRTCPACQASVLEDDAAECPFCGASMTTGKQVGQAQPKAAPKSTPAEPAAAGKPAAKPAGAAAKKPAAKGAAAKNDSGDPFDVDTSAARNAVAVQPRPSKGRMLRIVCPMCEKAGFISPQDVGKEVKCANPSCLVPVFVARSSEKTEPEPEPDAASGSGKLWMYVGLALLVVAGGGLTFFLKQQKPVESTGPLFTPPAERTEEEKENDKPKTPVAVPEAPPQLTREQILTTALGEMQQASNESGGGRARNYAARMLAEAQMEAGHAAEARKKLNDLDETSKYQGAATLLIDAWRLLDAGDAAAAKPIVDEAAANRTALPKQGRDALDIAGALAAALVATGRMDEARSLAAEINDSTLGQLSTVWRGTVESPRLPFEVFDGRSALQEIPHPQWATVTLTLAVHRRWTEARQWALAAPDVAVRDACIAIVAAELVAGATQPAEVQAELDQLAAAVDGAGTVRFWVAVGQGRLERNDTAGATEAAQKAGEALDALQPPAPLKLPGMADLYKLASQAGQGLPDAASLHSAALAAADLAELQARLGTKDQLLSRAERGLAFLAGMAPPLSETKQLVAGNQQPPPVRRALAQALDLTETQAFSAFSTYQEQSLTWHARAERRLQLEQRLLDRVARAGAVEEVWKFIQPASGGTSAATQQSWVTTGLTASLQQLAGRDGLPILAEIETTMRSNRIPLDATDVALAAVARLKTPGQRDAALRDLQTYYNRPAAERSRVDRAFLSTVVTLSDWNPPQLVSFLTQLPDPLIREDALRLIAARRTLAGQATQLLRDFNSRGTKETDRLAFFRGIVEGAAELPNSPQPSTNK